MDTKSSLVCCKWWNYNSSNGWSPSTGFQWRKSWNLECSGHILQICHWMRSYFFGFSFSFSIILSGIFSFLQIFRSIDSGSVKGFPRHVGTARNQVCVSTNFARLMLKNHICHPCREIFKFMTSTWLILTWQFNLFLSSVNQFWMSFFSCRTLSVQKMW